MAFANPTGIPSNTGSPPLTNFDQNLSALSVHLHFLRKEHRQEAVHWYLGMQELQARHRRWCLHSCVRINYLQPPPPRRADVMGML